MPLRKRTTGSNSFTYFSFAPFLSIILAFIRPLVFQLLFFYLLSLPCPSFLSHSFFTPPFYFTSCLSSVFLSFPFDFACTQTWRWRPPPCRSPGKSAGTVDFTPLRARDDQLLVQVLERACACQRAIAGEGSSDSGRAGVGRKRLGSDYVRRRGGGRGVRDRAEFPSRPERSARSVVATRGALRSRSQVLKIIVLSRGEVHSVLPRRRRSRSIHRDSFGGRIFRIE